MRDFRLLETMRLAEDGEVFLLERHLHRLRRSARFFSFKHDSERVRSAIPAGIRSCRLRLTLSEDGTVDADTAALPQTLLRHLRLSPGRVNSRNPFLYHKTTKREIYDEARRGCDEFTDVILLNERDELTETTIMNIAVFREGVWITPALSCGLLPGVLRAEMLAAGKIVEGIVRADDLLDGEPIRCFNALRGVLDATLAK